MGFRVYKGLGFRVGTGLGFRVYKGLFKEKLLRLQGVLSFLRFD